MKGQESNPRPHTPRPAALPVKVEQWVRSLVIVRSSTSTFLMTVMSRNPADGGVSYTEFVMTFLKSMGSMVVRLTLDSHEKASGVTVCLRFFESCARQVG